MTLFGDEKVFNFPENDRMKSSVHTVQLVRTEGGSTTQAADLVVVEEPLEIRLGHGPEPCALQVMMKSWHSVFY